MPKARLDAHQKIAAFSDNKRASENVRRSEEREGGPAAVSPELEWSNFTLRSTSLCRRKMKKKKHASFMGDGEAGWLSANEWRRIMNEGSTVGVFGSVSAVVS